MPFYTRHYGLPAWKRGEVIDTVVDNTRMCIIDSQLELLSRTLGDGKMSGWNVSANSSTSDKIQLTLSEGRGIINKFAATSFGDFEFELNKSSTYYMYLQKKKDVTARFSSLSNRQLHTYVDMIGPSAPTGLAENTKTYNTITLEWDANSEHDISYYILQRSTDNITFNDLVAVEHSSTNTYQDTNLTENTEYYYRISAVDVNDNSSSFSSSVMIKTNTDTRVPSDPAYFSSFPLDESIQLAWQASSFGSLKEYRLTIAVLNDELEVESSSLEVISSSATTYEVNSLDNSKNYKFTLVSRSVNNIDSAGVSIISSPRNSSGPLEVQAVSLTDAESNLNTTGIALQLSWTAGFNEYVGPPNRFLITIIENGSKVSEPIEAFADQTSLTIDNYQLSGTQIFEPIKPRTDYIVKIQSDFEVFSPSPTTSSGKIAKVKTVNYKDPMTVKEIFSKEDSSNSILVFTWTKSVEVFNHYEMTLTRLDTTGVTTTMYSTRNLGKANSFVVEDDDYVSGSTYTISLKVVDEYSNKSTAKTLVVTTTSSTNADTGVTATSRPPHAFELKGMSGDNVIHLQWLDAVRIKENTGFEVDTFHIYRALNQDRRFLSWNLFQEIASVPADRSFYEDYDVENNRGYLYFVLITDKNGFKSLNPEDDKYYTYPYFLASPYDSVDLSSPSGLALSVSGADVTLEWDAGDTPSDGFEVFKRVDSSYEVERPVGINFIEAQEALDNTISITSTVGLCDLQICNDYQLIENVPKGQTSVTLNDVLVEDGTYEFRIRRYRNDINIILKTEQVAPVDSILLAKIETGTSELNTTITDLSTDISNGTSLIENVVGTKVNDHTHYLKAKVDKRIDLSENVVVRDWTTSDGITFTSNETIDGANYYVLRDANGNILNYEFNVNTTNKQITIFYPDGASALTSILVECVGLNETSGQIEGEQLGDIFANKIKTGKLDKQLPVLQHFGREDEDLIPLQIPLTTIDGFMYQNYDDVDSEFGETISFYDVMSISGDNFIAGSSLGILESDDAGESWDISVEVDVPVHKLYYSSVLGRYFGLSGNSVLISADGLSWLRTFGLERTFITRDIEQDDDRVYVSTDAGVFSMQATDLLNWTETSVVSAESTDSYDLIYDSTNSRMLVSTQLSYYESTDKGTTWTQITEINELDPISDSVISGSYIYAIQDNGVWRKQNVAAEFSKIGFIDVGQTRKIVVFDNSIFVTTSDGLYRSDSEADIEADIEIDFNKVGEIDAPFKNFIPLSINLIDEKMYVGSDQELIKFDDANTNETIYTQDTTSQPPTFYVNGLERKLGVFYNNDLVVFDEKNDELNLVSVANQYRLFRPEKLGWADNNYKSIAKVKNNNVTVDTLASSVFPSSLASYQFGDGSVYPYSEAVASSAAANFAKKEYNTELARAVSINSGNTSLLNTNETLEIAVAKVFAKFYEVFSNINGNVKFYTPITINGIDYKLVDHILIPPNLESSVFPDNNIQLYLDSNLKTLANNTQVDSISGLVILQSETGKINRMSIDLPGTFISGIGDNSHAEIDDEIDEVNSGLPSNFANVFQSNIVKMGIELDSIFNNAQESGACNVAPPLNSVYIIPRNKLWYDNLNSTIDYELEVSCDSPNVNADYVTSVLYLSAIDKVWVGHDEGVLAIDKDDYDITEVDFNNGRKEFVTDIKLINNVVYIVTKKAVYQSSNYGSSWSELSTFNIKEDLKHINSVNGVLVLTSVEKVYYKKLTHVTNFLSETNWKVASFIQPLVNAQDDAFVTATETITSMNAAVIFGRDFGFVIGDNVPLKTTSGATYSLTGNGIYISSNGFTWSKIGELVSQDISGDSFDPDAPSALTTSRKVIVNAVTNIDSIHILATDKGLYSSEASFYGQNADIGLIDLENNKTLSAEISFNDVAVENASTRRILAGASDGTFWLSSGGTWTEGDSGLETINKVLFVDNKYWIFGKNALKVSGENKAIRLTPGMDFVE